MIKNIKVKKNDETTRLDKWLKRNFSSLTQSFIEKNIRKKNILVNNLKKSSNYKVKYEDEINILNYNFENYKHIKFIKQKVIIPIKIKKLFYSSIIFQNKNFIIIDKWGGISTQGGTKVSISIDHIIKDISSSYNLVHRLDKDTSGLLIIAKNLKYTTLFGKLFKNQNIEKKYIALCHGQPKNKESFFELDIKDKKNKNISHSTKTYYKVLNNQNNISQILFIPSTGKTHQLRIVSKKLGCPIIGDQKYNSQKNFNFEKLKLNANKLKFNLNNNKYEFSSKIPKDFINFLIKNNLKFVDY